MDNQSPAPRKLPLQSSLVKNIFRSRAVVEEGSENGVDARKEEEPNIEPTKKQITQAENHLNNAPSIPERDSSKSRQLELLSVSGLSFILRNLIRELDVDKTYFVLDGVDECIKGEQEALMSTLFQLWDVNPGKFKVLVVSRPMGGMGVAPTIKLEQITSDIEKFVHKSVEPLGNIDGFGEIQKEVEESLLEGAEGTFLWVSLVMREIKNVKTCTEILAAIKSVPKGLNNKYRHMLQQIDAKHQRNVYQMLCWITVAVRPLTLSELSVIIESPASHLMSPEGAVCDGVTFSEGLLETRGDEVTFVHISAKDFLLSDETGNDESLQRFHVGLEKLHYERAQFCYDYIRQSDLLRHEVRVSELSDRGTEIIEIRN